MPNEAQPSQKGFDSQILAKLESFNADFPVFVESESKKIGLLRIPDTLIEAMWASPCLRLESPLAVRVALLRNEYAHFLQDPALLRQQLDRLQGMHSNELLAHWHTLCEAQSWDEFIAELLEQHYDPAYNKSICRHYPNYKLAYRLTLNSLNKDAINELAHEALALSGDFVNNGGTV